MLWLCRIYSDSGKERENAMKLILASGSPRRKELLTRAGAEFEVCVSDVDESGVFGTPEEVVSALSEMKGAAVFASHKNDCVLSADTVVALDGEIFGKPKDADDALRRSTCCARCRCAATPHRFPGGGDEFAVQDPVLRKGQGEARDEPLSLLDADVREPVEGTD